jgi:hypothetical protein
MILWLPHDTHGSDEAWVEMPMPPSTLNALMEIIIRKLRMGERRIDYYYDLKG